MAKKNKEEVVEGVEESQVNDEAAAPVEVLETIYEDTVTEEQKAEGFIPVQAKKNGKTATIAYNFGKDLEAMIAFFNSDVTFSQARAQMVVKLQAAMRAAIVGGKDVAELKTIWKPGVAMPKTPVNKEAVTINFFDGLSPEAQAEMIAKLQERAAGGK